ncbi:putative colanic acid biosynthesis acetyltransferase [Rhizobium sp. BK251]|uniref:putative colanic acid biosynthesis acetyltransferase n=1 Tax=Rhizobium sp. BK251 TaxID=2512125 RepID=UPI0010536330|nr:putative colanic acid biosynthesis acetyltransferase [Rhizobium sp. BK251]TCL72981.1 putative colanic acid biosynthesis acetyltransferase WcaF [Rhizobium sp. BK251]
MTILDAKLYKPREGGPTFPLKHRLTRLAWGIVWNGLGTWTPVPFHGWRRFLLNAFGARIDPTAKVYPHVRVWYPRNLAMARFSCLARDVNCYCMDTITLGEYALVSQGAHLCGGTHDVDDPDFPLIAKPISIGDNAWVAAEAFVGPGVTIGSNAVLGARAVTVKSLAEGMIYAGNPARPIRARSTAGSDG